MRSLSDLILPKNKYFGLSIERNSLHAVELDVRGNPVRTAEAIVPPDTFIDGMLTKKDALSSALSSLLSKGQFSTPYVAVTFPEVFAYSREYTLPIIPMDEIQEAVTWHAKDLFPFPESDIYYDWKILQVTDKEYHTVVVAAQKKILDPLLSVLLDLHLKPLRFEPDASAIARLLRISPASHAILIEINKQGAYVTLVEGEKALFTTVIAYLQEDTPAVYLANINQTLIEIATFYQNKGVLTPGSTNVVVTGDMASDQWVAHLQELLRYPTATLQTHMDNVGYNKAYAAAKYQITPPMDEQSINLVPLGYQEEYDIQRTIQFYRAILMRISVVAGILCFFSFVCYFLVSVQRQQLDAKVKSLRRLTEMQRSDTKNLLLLNIQAKNVVSLAPLRKTIQYPFSRLVELINTNITITQWEYDDTKLTFKLSGMATTREELLLLKKILEDSGVFAKVVLPLGSLERPTQVPFIITFILK